MSDQRRTSWRLACLTECQHDPVTGTPDQRAHREAGCFFDDDLFTNVTPEYVDAEPVEGWVWCEPMGVVIPAHHDAYGTTIVHGWRDDPHNHDECDCPGPHQPLYRTSSEQQAGDAS